MSKAVVIVESPAKVKTIDKILGGKYKVIPSMGHLIDLPKSSLGVNVEEEFKPNLIVVRSKRKIFNQLKKDIEKAKEIYVATDPDREGEAIGWNLINQLEETHDRKVYRVTFQEITKEAVLKAFDHPRDFDLQKINAQMARRVLDRIVGYKISPILWKKVGSHLSAGRVQSVALRLIVERERAIQSFVPQEYWQITVDLKKEGSTLTANLEKIGGKDFELKNKEAAENIAKELKQQNFVVSNIIEREVKRNPSAAFITSTLQQEAFNKLGFNAQKTMLIAQKLYEGVDLGQEETVGLITYMRTDSVNVSQEAITKVREFIQKDFGEKYLPQKPNEYKSKKMAQEAHEAIRPADVLRKPEDLKKYLEKEEWELYELIWRRFVSSQMTSALYQYRKIEITAGQFQLGASGSELLFDGFLTLANKGEDEEEKNNLMPYLKGDALELLDVKPSQHFTKPPARYSEASLVKALEEEGIGRPSTYASIIQTLVFRNYVVRNRGYFTSTELGILICDLLVEYFAKIMDVKFTAQMEENLDLVEEGNLEYGKLLKEFYEPFHNELEHALKTIVKKQEFVDRYCPQCGLQMVVKWGRRGQFLSCSGFPQCNYAQAFPVGVQCPEEGCGGELVRRRSRRGEFYGCSNYPKCTYVTNELPQKT